MNKHLQPLTGKAFFQDRNREICRMYFELIKREREENPLRAKYIGKFYYAQSIADSMASGMGITLSVEYILKIINDTLKRG